MQLNNIILSIIQLLAPGRELKIISGGEAAAAEGVVEAYDAGDFVVAALHLGLLRT